MSRRVLLLRHAESANPSIFHGAESDVGLSERGRRQAEAIAQVLADYRPGRLVSSAMLRARATAEPIARVCGLDIEIEPDLHERRVGALSGTPTGLSEGVWPDTLNRWLAGETGYAPEGAESFDAIRQRVLPVWERVTAPEARQKCQPGLTVGGGTPPPTVNPLVIVAHGIVCRVLLLSVLPGYTVADWKRLGPIHNVAITELVREADPLNPGGMAWRSVRLNDVPGVIRAVT